LEFIKQPVTVSLEANGDITNKSALHGLVEGDGFLFRGITVKTHQPPPRIIKRRLRPSIQTATATAVDVTFRRRHQPDRNWLKISPSGL
jgi:hypothetical protein